MKERLAIDHDSFDSDWSPFFFLAFLFPKKKKLMKERHRDEKNWRHFLLLLLLMFLPTTWSAASASAAAATAAVVDPLAPLGGPPPTPEKEKKGRQLLERRHPSSLASLKIRFLFLFSFLFFCFFFLRRLGSSSSSTAFHRVATGFSGWKNLFTHPNTDSHTLNDSHTHTHTPKDRPTFIDVRFPASLETATKKTKEERAGPTSPRTAGHEVPTLKSKNKSERKPETNDRRPGGAGVGHAILRRFQGEKPKR